MKLVVIDSITYFIEQSFARVKVQVTVALSSIVAGTSVSVVVTVHLIMY